MNVKKNRKLVVKYTGPYEQIRSMQHALVQDVMLNRISGNGSADGTLEISLNRAELFNSAGDKLFELKVNMEELLIEFRATAFNEIGFDIKLDLDDMTVKIRSSEQYRNLVRNMTDEEKSEINKKMDFIYDCIEKSLSRVLNQNPIE